MKTTYRIPRFLAACSSIVCFSACVTTETRMPDGTIIKVTEPAVGATETAAMLAGAVAHEVISEK